GQLDENFEKTRAFKLYETCRRLYQKIAVTPGVTYNFSVETRAEKGEEDDNNVIEVNNLEVYILNTEIEDENGLTGAVGGFVDHYVNIIDHLNNSKPSQGNNTFTKTEFSFTATTSTVVIYMRAPLATSSAYDVYVDNVSLKAAAVASVANVFADNITIYPNPVTNFINISTTEKISNVEVYNIVGKRVLSIKNLENNQVDISNLASGMYMLRLTNGTSVTTKKIMKQ
ncbi:MAG: T9SS type A sorting domain-containing protein, partial [Flavobacteriales bacterium]